MSLEDKIVEAKELGIEFILVPKGEGIPPNRANEFYIGPAWTDKMFEEELDKVMAKFKEVTFLGILAKHKLI